MRISRCFIASIFIVLGVSAQAASVQVTALYRERIALPPMAVLAATIEDVSLADAPSVMIGEKRLDPAGQPPYKFEISYDPARIEAGHRYNVRIRISDGDKLLFITDRSYPVLGAGDAAHANIVLHAVAQRAPVGRADGPLGNLPASFSGNLPCADYSGQIWRLSLFADQAYALQISVAGTPATLQNSIGRWRVEPMQPRLTLEGPDGVQQFEIQTRDALRKLDSNGMPIESKLNYTLQRQSDEPLLDTYWKLLMLDGQPVAAAQGRREPSIVLASAQGRVSGSDGCNRLMGAYTLAGNTLSFGKLAGTMMMCPDGMEQARAFAQALGRSARFKLGGRYLELLDAEGKLIARFEAVALKH